MRKMIDFHSRDFEEYLDRRIEEKMGPYKLSVLKDVFLTKDEFKEENNKIWVELQKQREENSANFKRIDSTISKIESSISKLETTTSTMQLTLMEIQNKSGPALEQLVLNLMQETIKLQNIDPQKIQKAFLIDKEGNIFERDTSIEVDVLIENGNVYLIEVKATADKWDIWHLIQKGKLYEQVYGKKATQLILIAFRMKAEFITKATNNNIKVIVGTIL